MAFNTQASHSNITTPRLPSSKEPSAITPTIGITNRAFGVQVAKDPTRFDDARFKTLFPESVVRDMERLVEQGKTTPQELAKTIDEEIALNKKLTAAMGIKPQ